MVPIITNNNCKYFFFLNFLPFIMIYLFRILFTLMITCTTLILINTCRYVIQGHHIWEGDHFSLFISSDSEGWCLKNVWFSFYPWCVQSELSLVKHCQKSKVSQLFKPVLTFDFWPCFTRDNSEWTHQR